MEASTPKKPIRLRMAPSPTGYLHIGTARATLFNWLMAKHLKGTFILRIEDTDKERSRPEYEKQLIEGLHWLGLEWDEGPDLDQGGNLTSRGDYGPYRQSERTSIYRKYLEKLLTDGRAYYCYCTTEELEAQRQLMEADGLPPKYNGRCAGLASPPPDRDPQVIRFRVQENKIKFRDIIRGNMEFDTALFGDLVVAKDLDSPLYNFAVVIDDEEMKISHVVRGEDHLANTPKQILIQQALGFETPIYAHLPLILNADRSKMSKRKNKASLLEYKTEGYLPEAMCNFLALLGWHPSEDNREIFSLDELIQEFELERVQKAGAIFNPEKLDWINGQYIKKMEDAELAEKLKPFVAQKRGGAEQNLLLRLVAITKERLKKLSDFNDLTEIFFSLPDYNPAMLVWKKSSPAETRDVIQGLNHTLDAAPEDIFESRETLVKALGALSQKYERGTLFWPLRVALSGQASSPDALDIAVVLGKKETISRLKTALNKTLIIN